MKLEKFQYWTTYNLLSSKNRLKIYCGGQKRDKNKYQTRSTLKQSINHINKVLGTNLTWHQARHTYVSILHKAGIDVKQAQAWTGHKTIRVLLDIYTHLDNEDNQQSINKLNEFVVN